MLVRNKPFKEWVNVYFDPTKTSEDKLLALLKKHRCPKASWDRGKDHVLNASNPFVSPGGIVQLELRSEKKKDFYKFTLPPNWTLTGNKQGVYDENLESAFYSVQVPQNAKSGKHTIKIASASGYAKSTTVEVVRRIDR